MKYFIYTLVWFVHGLSVSPKVSCARSLVPNVVMLTGGGAFWEVIKFLREINAFLMEVHSPKEGCYK